MTTRLLVCLVCLTAGCSSDMAYTKSQSHWGEVDDRPVHLYTVTNPNGVVLKMTDYGAKIVELHVPDRDGELADVVLGFDNLEQYVAPNQSIGATIGRYTNRIRDARFEIDGAVYQLTPNDGKNNIHGGGEFESTVWDAEFVENELGVGLRFSYRSPDGSHGFPGNLDSAVTYVLTEENAVHITFEAQTDKATHVNFTQHSYFNLNGAKTTVHDHVARIDADRYLVFDGVLATGEVDTLDDKPWDLRTPTRVGANLEEIPLGGYHHDYLINKPSGELAVVADVLDPASGRTLTVSSTQPDVTFYVAMGLTDELIGKYGITYGPYMAFCLETQHPVDAANHPDLSSTLLRPEQKYKEVVIYKFGVSDALRAGN